jgi:hypothetical protein
MTEEFLSVGGLDNTPAPTPAVEQKPAVEVPTTEVVEETKEETKVEVKEEEVKPYGDTQFPDQHAPTK